MFFKNDEIVDKIEALENEGMIDMMIHQKNRWYNFNSLFVKSYSPLYVWQKWIASK